MKEWLLTRLFNDFPPIAISSWGIVLLVVGTLIILGIILRSRIIKSRRLALRDKYSNKFEDLLTSFIFEEDEFGLDSPAYHNLVKNLRSESKCFLKRKVLVATILLLHRDFKGTPEQRLVRLYHDIGLQQFAFNSIRYGSWYEKAFEFTELGQMQVAKGLPLVLGYIDHYNTILREEAQFAAVRMGGVDNLRFMSTLNRPISDWQQTRIMQELDQFSLDQIPSFYYLLDSKNDSTKIFGLKLITKYRQIEEAEKLVSFIWHENIKVSIAALNCLVGIDYFQVVDELLTLFYSYDEEFQPEVVKAIGVLGNEEHITFLEELLVSNNYNLVMEATKALIRLGYKLPTNTTHSQLNKEIYKHARYELVP